MRGLILWRVFNFRRMELMNELINANVMSRTGSVDVIEFQKCGLPHSHIRFLLKATDRLQAAQEVDQVIIARLQPDQMHFQKCHREGSTQIPMAFGLHTRSP